MTVLNKLASALGRRDELPNQELAQEILNENNKEAVQELVQNLNNKSKNIQNDCIKVLYEIGERKPSLIALYLDDFFRLLDSKNNRLQWGAMTAIDKLTLEDPKAVYDALPTIINAADKGSVITRDHAVNILTKLCTTKYSKQAFPLLIEQLQNCPTNQLPMYAENAAPIINENHKPAFIKLLTSRMNELEKESQKKRVEKILKKLA